MILYHIADVSGGNAYPVYGPMWAEDPTLIQRFRQEPSIASAMGRYDAIDVLMVGIGSWRPPGTGLHLGLPAEWRKQARSSSSQADSVGPRTENKGPEAGR